MRTRPLPVAAALLVLCAAPVSGGDIATANVSVNLHLATRTSLKVSSRILTFEVNRPGEPVTAAVDFTAGARTPATSDVVLTVEALQQTIDQRGGAADAAIDLSFTGEGDGMLAGSVAASRSTVVGRWQGSGVRAGRIRFILRANDAGSYALPVRFVLSTP